MQLLYVEATFKPSSPFGEDFTSENLSQDSSLTDIPLCIKDVGITYFEQNFLLALLAYMESATTHIHELLLLAVI